MKQKKLVRIWSNQVGSCYYCGEDLSTFREVYSGFCEKCMKKKNMVYLKWDKKKFFE